MSWHRLARAATALLTPIFALGLLMSPMASVGAATDFAAIDAHARATMDAWGAPGLSLGIARDGEVVHTAAFGVAGPNGRAMTTQTAVVIGSVGKSLTALAIRQLADQGAIDPNAPVTRYLPWFRLDAPDSAVQAVTIRRLLEHTSGLSTASGQDPALYASNLTMAEVVASMAGVRPDRAAGTYEYSNLNFVVLGAVIEAVSGRSYGDYLGEHVFGTLGMTNSGTSPAGGAAAPAQGHRYLFGLATPFDEPFPSGMVAAGFQLSSAEDMARYVAALSNGGALGDVVVAGPPAGTADRPKFGIDWQPVPAGSVSNQSGATLSTNANIVTFADDRLAVVVLVNANPIQLLGLPAGASDLALDLARLARSGGAAPAASEPPTVRLVYSVVDAILLALALLLAVHAWRAPSWARRLAGTRRRRWFMGRTVIADAILPTAVLLGLPLLIGATGSSPAGEVLAGWRFLAWTLPDLAVAVAVLCAGALLIGAFKVATTLRTGRRHAPLGRAAFIAG